MDTQQEGSELFKSLVWLMALAGCIAFWAGLAALII
jgi:hypothetical protein